MASRSKSRRPAPAKPPARRAVWVWGLAGIGVCVAAALLIPFGGAARRQAPGTAQSDERPQAAAAPVQYGYQVVNTYPHDPTAFTQGLLYRDGVLYESTGLEGRSTVRRVRLETGEVLQRHDVAPQYFAEGLVDTATTLVQLTWQSNVGFVYDLKTFGLLRTFRYAGEGWGLTREGSRLVMSDGTSTLRFLDPETLQQTGAISVTDAGAPVSNLNELEAVKGEIFANVWQTDDIVAISPATGRVTARIDLGGLLPAADRQGHVDVLNGIAYDAQGDRLFVTGKLWPRLFEIRLQPPR